MNAKTKKLKKMIHLGEIDFSIYPGHVTATEFNRAFNKDFRGGSDWINKSELTFEYWTVYKNGKRQMYRRSKKENKKAKPFTVNQW